MRMAIIAMHGVFGSGLATLVDIVNTAEMARPSVDAAIPRLSVDIVASGRVVKTGAGWSVPVTAGLERLPEFDVVTVAGFGAMSGSATTEAITTRDGRSVVSALVGLAEAPVQIAAACTGAFALAEAGLLDERRATTSWWAGATFRQRYPKVHLDLDAMIVVDEPIVTAGAAFSHVDLGLTLIGRVSGALASRVASLLVIDERSAQTSYVAVDHLPNHDPVVIEFERLVRADLANPVSIGEMASTLGTSRRSLERRTHAALGMSPLTLVRRLRYERAVHLRRTTGQSIEQIARQVGYANASTLSTLLRAPRT
jgi:transcriptional regulator GlxA family with amidase domain